MEQIVFANQNEKNYALACLIFAEKIGLIDDCSLDAVAARCIEENSKRKALIENNKTVYGLKSFTPLQYLDYELTRFKLDFASESEKIKCNYQYTPITKSDKKTYYKNNRDLFTRYEGDSFKFRELEMIIEKKIREEQYENEIKNILCQFS